MEQRTKRSTHLFTFIASLIVFSLLFFYIGKTTSTSNTPKAVAQQPSTLIKATIAPPKAEQLLDKSFVFPVNNQNGKNIGQFTYTLQKADLQDQIVSKGATATAVQGKTFLVLTILLKNDTNNGYAINTKDYVRLSVNGKPDLFAPDIYDDPVALQAISTTQIQLGFSLDEQAKNLLLHVGEINGTKTTIPLSLH